MSEHQVIHTVTSDAAFISVTGQSYEECHENNGFLCDYPEMWFWAHVYTVLAGITMKVHFHYDDSDRLYRVLFAVADDRSAAFFDTLVKDEAEVLASIITRSRGQPSWTRRPTIFDMEAGYIKYTHTWPADQSDVVHAVGIGEVRSTFYAALDVTWEPLADAVRRHEGDALEQQIEESAGDF